MPFVAVGVVVTLFFIYVDLLALAVLTGILSAFTIYFFRDPERVSDAPEKTVLAPADGKVLGIQYLDGTSNLLGKPAVKVSVFMSIFDVHVNRIPASGKVSNITYHEGRFFSANRDKASEQNEYNRIALETKDGERIVFVQIAGLVARRIACWIREGDEVRVGQRFGLIRFGSRVDLYLPYQTRITAAVSQKVKAGKTILGYLS